MSASRVLVGIALAGLAATAGIAGCETQGPAERVGEEIDEAVDRIREGEESLATKLDDAVDEVRDEIRQD